MEYETILSEYVNYGRNKFIEISKKRVKPEDGSKPENAFFVNISKGYYAPDGEKRYQRGIGFPPEEAIVNSLIEKLQNVMSSLDEGEMGKSSDLDD
jgi:hypothetical protein